MSSSRYQTGNRPGENVTRPDFDTLSSKKAFFQRPFALHFFYPAISSYIESSLPAALPRDRLGFTDG